MRSCAKLRCDAEPVATVSLLYRERRVVMSGLTLDRDPSLLDLCRDHAERMTPPRGWALVDERASLSQVAPSLASAVRP